MPTQEIESTKWEAFCKKFLELNRGTLMTVNHVALGGQSSEVVRDMPLTGVRMESSGCNNSIFLNFSQAGRREITHEIIEPIHIALREGNEGHKGLQIDAENGATIVLFHSGRVNELLQGIS
jgi:hypothetical protein